MARASVRRILLGIRTAQHPSAQPIREPFPVSPPFLPIEPPAPPQPTCRLGTERHGERICLGPVELPHADSNVMRTTFCPVVRAWLPRERNLASDCRRTLRGIPFPRFPRPGTALIGLLSRLVRTTLRLRLPSVGSNAMRTIRGAVRPV